MRVNVFHFSFTVVLLSSSVLCVWLEYKSIHTIQCIFFFPRTAQQNKKKKSKKDEDDDPFIMLLETGSTEILKVSKKHLPDMTSHAIRSNLKLINSSQ